MIIDFRMTPPPVEWIDLEEFRHWFRTSGMRGYLKIYPWLEEFDMDLTTDQLINNMDEAGADGAVLQAEWAVGDYRKQNDAVYRLVQKYPDKFIAGFLCANPLEEDDMARVIEREVKERGFKGVNLQPFILGMRPNDRRFYPIYAKCQELGIPVTTHTSINFTLDRTIDFSRPIHLDEVACDFPDLVLVANHGGWPWVLEMIAVAWKHPNVYIETGGVSPKYIGGTGTGWEPLMRYGNSILQDKILMASDNVLPIKRAVEEMKELPLKDEVKKKWLGENAARLLGLNK
ncbi:MAG: amidohydrolase family protein [Dehalococcoidia bacterium]